MKKQHIPNCPGRYGRYQRQNKQGKNLPITCPRCQELQGGDGLTPYLREMRQKEGPSYDGLLRNLKTRILVANGTPIPTWCGNCQAYTDAEPHQRLCVRPKEETEPTQKGTCYCKIEDLLAQGCTCGSIKRYGA